MPKPRAVPAAAAALLIRAASRLLAASPAAMPAPPPPAPGPYPPGAWHDPVAMPGYGPSPFLRGDPPEDPPEGSG